MKNRKYRTLTDLYNRLLKEGIIGYAHINNFRQFWIYPREKSGVLVLPRDSSSKRRRLLTLKQIKEIVVAFSPGGTGHWSYLDL